MKTIKRRNLEELAKIMPIVNEKEQRIYIGGSGCTYTFEEFQYKYLSGNWTGGDVIDYGYISENGMIENNTSADGCLEVII